MSKDPGEKEKEFIDGLQADTGRDLDAWMRVLDGQLFGHRNDMIDWLRRQGMTFSRASRLERLHHNGGKPLYGVKQPLLQPVLPPSGIGPADIAPRPGPATIVPVNTGLSGQHAEAPRAGSDGQSIETMLAKAKGYRPLAELVLREMRRAVPTLTLTMRDAVAYVGAPAIFAALTATAKDVRLNLDLGDRPSDEFVRPGRLLGGPSNLSHIIVLNDARKVDAALIALFNEAQARANP